MFLPSVVGMANDLEESAKIQILNFKIAALLQDHEQLGRHFALHTRTTQGTCMCLQNIIGICNNEGARSGTKIQAHILDPPPTLTSLKTFIH